MLYSCLTGVVRSNTSLNRELCVVSLLSKSAKIHHSSETYPFVWQKDAKLDVYSLQSEFMLVRDV